MSFKDIKFNPVECKWCGKEFLPSSYKNVFCSKECVYLHKKAVEKSRPKKVKEKKKSNQELIIDVAREAKAHGMSYGQYVAMMYLRG